MDMGWTDSKGVAGGQTYVKKVPGGQAYAKGGPRVQAYSERNDWRLGLRHENKFHEL